MTDELFDFYCNHETNGNRTGGSRYEIWERGEALNDSVTPSTYCESYRQHMVLKIISLAKSGKSVFSIGCGNAFVEAELVEEGLYVEAIDCNEEAVKLASAKGIEAFKADYFNLPAGYFSTFNVVYADGLIGHLYEPNVGLDRFFEMLISLKLSPGTFIVISNDAPLESGLQMAPNKSVNGFWLLSKNYINEIFIRYGYDIWESYTYPYKRPISGLRDRSICIARVPENLTER